MWREQPSEHTGTGLRPSPDALAKMADGTKYAPAELTLRATGAAYRARHTGSPADLRELIEVASDLPNTPYRDLLIDHACTGPDLPAELVTAARRIQKAEADAASAEHVRLRARGTR